jgi:hypothetical protein
MLQQKKFYISLLLAIIYIILSLPISFSWSDKLLKSTKIRTTYDNCPGLPTVWGNIVHGIIFVIIAYIILTQKDLTISPPIKIEKIPERTIEIDIQPETEQ